MTEIIGIEKLSEDINKWLSGQNEYVKGGVRHAISETINQVSRQVKNALSATDLRINSPMKEGGTLYKGINQYLWKKETNPDMSVGVINILGDRNNNDGTWRLRFFEAGTKERISKTGKKLGAIHARWFFKSGISNIEEILKNNVDNAIRDAVDKINNKV